MDEYAKDINYLAKFCGKKDLENLTKENLAQRFNLEQVDICVLFGGSILKGGDVLAEAIKNNVAKKYIVVGGYGHTSATLFEQMEREYPESTENIHSEAKLFEKYLELKYQLSPDFLEVNSTNCGNNITNLLSVINENKIEMNSILLIQDATMQRRMDATLKKYLSKSIPIINYPAYRVEVISTDNILKYQSTIPNMWELDRYVSLLMGEIPRLMDNETGYGPKGKKFMSHVDVPDRVVKSYENLKRLYPDGTRVANPEFE